MADKWENNKKMRVNGAVWPFHHLLAIPEYAMPVASAVADSSDSPFMSVAMSW